MYYIYKGFYIGMKVHTDVVGAGKMEVWKGKIRALNRK